MFIQRYLEAQLKEALVPGKAVVILGARRVGKTTLIKNVISQEKENTKFINCDDPDVITQFNGIGLSSLKRIFADTSLIIFDEVQRIKNVGILLKMIVDEMPDKKLLVSGSSSLDLSNEINEPLTGRKKTFYLFSICFLELWEHENRQELMLRSYLDQALRFGSYPKIFDFDTAQEKEDYLMELASDYLYQDVLQYQEVRNPDQLRKLLVALALQIGQEVSYPELANIVGIDQKTVIRYLDLLEKGFVIFRLPALSRNMRKEISKSRKIYFCDLGIRNALIKNFNSYDLRQDKGQVWENFLINERRKKDLYKKELKNYYFWRTYDQKEVDLVEESSGKMAGFEFKWKSQKIKKPTDFLDAYPGSSFKRINNSSFLDFVL